MADAFQPDPSWPSILELATKLWGEPTDWMRGGNEARFGSRGSKSVLLKEQVWSDYEGGADSGGGYRELCIMALGAFPPPDTGHTGHTRAKPNGAGNGHANDEPKPWDHVGTVYQYPGPDGALILEVVRMLPGYPHKFSQRRPNGYNRDGSVKWRWSVRDIPQAARPLYRLPELLASADAARTVWIVEGEKDADNLAALGLIATTNVGGAGKWRAEYAQVLRERHVVILPDNDPQSIVKGAPLWHPDGRPVCVGQDHAETIAASLHGIAASVRVLMLPGLLPKGDVSDWLADGGTRHELEHYARELDEWVPRTPQKPPEDVPDDEDEDGEGGGEDEPPKHWDDIPALVIEPGSLITEQFAMRTFINAHHEHLRFNHASGGWLIWAEHFWRPDERKLAFSWALELCRTLASTIDGKDPSKGRLVVEKVRFSAAVEQGARAMPQVATAQGDWDANPMLLGTPGGVVDLATGILRPGERTDMISRTTSVTPSEMPDCPTWIAFLTYALNDDDQLVRFVQRYFGYCLTGVTIEEVFLFVFGPGGAGKGTTVETIAAIMGDYASTVPMEVFTGKTWSPTEYYRASMAGQRLIVANEPERGAYWAEAFIKETTGGDALSGRHPMGRPFRFKPSHKMALQGNHMPKLKGKSTGMQRRLNVLPFIRKPVTPDQHLKAKLMAEGPGILRWLIEGCLAWQKRKLDPPDAVLKASNRYFETQDVFARWIEERCDLHDGFATETGKLRADFNQWAKANGEDEMNGNDFAEAVDQHDPPFKRGKSHGGKRLVWGIGLKPPEPSDNWRDI